MFFHKLDAIQGDKAMKNPWKKDDEMEKSILRNFLEHPFQFVWGLTVLALCLLAGFFSSPANFFAELDMLDVF